MSPTVASLLMSAAALAINALLWWAGRGTRSEHRAWIAERAHVYIPSQWDANRCGHIWWSDRKGPTRQGLACDSRRRHWLHRRASATGRTA